MLRGERSDDNRRHPRRRRGVWWVVVIQQENLHAVEARDALLTVS